MRRLLVVVLLALSGVVLTEMPAHACRCVQQSVKESAQAADVVFSGVLVDRSTGTSGPQGKQARIYSIEAETLYSGDLTTASVDVVSLENSCTLGNLATDRPYVFFVQEQTGELRADRCGGTTRATDDVLRKVERTLGEGTSLGGSGGPGEPVEPTFTQVADAEPEALTRIAAPGAALVLIGLLGLLVVRRAAARD